MKKVLLTIIILAIIAGGGIFYWKTFQKKSRKDDPQTRIVTARKGTIIESVEANGKIASKLDVEIKCKASGEITELPFDVSSDVKKGDLLMQLDPADEERNVSKARVALESAQARLDRASDDLKISMDSLEDSRKQYIIDLGNAKVKVEDAVTKEGREKQLYEQKLVGTEEYDTSHTATVQAQADYEQAKLKLETLKTSLAALELKRKDLSSAKSDVDSDKIDLAIAEQRLVYTKVYAPMDGIITALNVQKGQIIASGIDNVGGGTSIMTLSNVSRIYVLAQVDESDIGDIELDQDVIITADAYPNERFHGVVDRIAQKGADVSNVVTFEVRIEVTSENKSLLKPEMTANIKVIIDRKDDAVIVPSDAITKVRATGGGRRAGGGMAAAGGGRNRSGGNGGRGGGEGGGGYGRNPEGTGGVQGASGWNGQGSRGNRPQRKPKQYVTVLLADGKTEQREVETGITDGENVEITSGLKEGEQIIINESEVKSSWNRDGAGNMPPPGGMPGMGGGGMRGMGGGMRGMGGRGRR